MFLQLKLLKRYKKNENISSFTNLHKWSGKIYRLEGLNLEFSSVGNH